MLEYLIVCTLVLMCAFCISVSARKNVRAVFIGFSFFVLLFFLVLREGYGNDYWSYVSIFENASGLIGWSHVQIETGWLWLNVLLHPIGFRALLVVTALVYLLVVFRFILREVPRRYVWLSFFLLLMEPSNFLVHLSAMRQTAALMVFILAIGALADKRIYLYILLVCLASLFHRSVLAMMPLALIALPEMSGRLSRLMSGRRWMALYVAVYALSAFALIKYAPTWLESLQSDVARYRGYQEAGGVGSGSGVVLQLVFCGMFISYALRAEGRARIILYMCSATYFILPLVLVNSMAARLMMYPQIALLVGLPLILSLERRKSMRIAIVAVFCAWTLLAFINFWRSDIYGPHYRDYQSVLSVW